MLEAGVARPQRSSSMSSNPAEIIEHFLEDNLHGCHWSEVYPYTHAFLNEESCILGLGLFRVLDFRLEHIVTLAAPESPRQSLRIRCLAHRVDNSRYEQPHTVHSWKRILYITRTGLLLRPTSHTILRRTGDLIDLVSLGLA